MTTVSNVAEPLPNEVPTKTERSDTSQSVEKLIRVILLLVVIAAVIFGWRAFQQDIADEPNPYLSPEMQRQIDATR